MDLDSRPVTTVTPDIGAHSPMESDAGDIPHLLQGVLRVGREWADTLSIHDPKLRPVTFLVEVTKNLLKDADYSLNAITTARSLLCCNCRRLNAVQGRCTGVSLHRCELLKAPASGSLTPPSTFNQELKK